MQLLYRYYLRRKLVKVLDLHIQGTSSCPDGSFLVERVNTYDGMNKCMFHSSEDFRSLRKLDMNALSIGKG